VRQPADANETQARAYTHFESPYETKYVLPPNLESAVIDQNESVGSWLGPVNIPSIPTGRTTRFGFKFGHKEVDTNAINTLLFTNDQVIGVMLGPDDLSNLRGSGRMSATANMMVEHYWEGGIEKGVQFEALNANHWGEMVDALTSQPLEEALKGHLNFGLAYERIQSVELKSRFINPGLNFHLADGSLLAYRTFKKDKLSEIGNYLKQQFVTVK